MVYDHSFTDDRAWFRFSFKWPDPKTGEPRSRAGIQSYRIEEGKLAETWIALQPLGAAWGDRSCESTRPGPFSDISDLSRVSFYLSSRDVFKVTDQAAIIARIIVRWADFVCRAPRGVKSDVNASNSLGTDCSRNGSC